MIVILNSCCLNEDNHETYQEVPSLLNCEVVDNHDKEKINVGFDAMVPIHHEQSVKRMHSTNHLKGPIQVGVAASLPFLWQYDL
jgi:hypothetical protein